jgi:hypothetical protein
LIKACRVVLPLNGEFNGTWDFNVVCTGKDVYFIVFILNCLEFFIFVTFFASVVFFVIVYVTEVGVVGVLN